MPRAQLSLIEFPADDPERAQRFWEALLEEPLDDRAEREGTGRQTRSAVPAVGVHARGRGPGDTASLPYFAVGDMAAALDRVRGTGNPPRLANVDACPRALEVVMRPPEVFVRELSPEEGTRLKSISKRAKYQSKRQRAMILLASSTGMPAPQIAAVVRSDESHVRKVIHAFNEQGFSSLDPDYRGGRPRKTTPAQRDRIVSVARARPDTQGVAIDALVAAQAGRAPGRRWGSCCARRRCVRRCARAGLTHQRTRSWKWSPDPEFADQGRASARPLSPKPAGRGGRLL